MATGRKKMEKLTWKKVRLFLGSTAYKTYLSGKDLYLEKGLIPGKYRILVIYRNVEGEMDKIGFSIENQKSTQAAKKAAEYLLALHVEKQR